MRSNVGLSLSLGFWKEWTRPGQAQMSRTMSRTMDRLAAALHCFPPLKHGTSQGKIRERLERPACLQRHYRTRCGIRRRFGGPKGRSAGRRVQ